MAQFSRILAVTVLLMLVVEGHWWPYAYCGGKLYNPSSQVCCGGKVYPKPCSCCGGKPYNPSSQGCCGGTSVYDGNRQMCCRGYVSHRPPNAVCCGTQGYNPDWDECCYKKGYPSVTVKGRCDDGIPDPVR